MLEVRLNVLRDVVDLFVIVESNYTFSGQPKERVLAYELQRYNEFPILYYAIDQSHLKDETDPWIRERDQRRSLKMVLDQLSDDDIVLVGDLDEIPHPDYVNGQEGHFHQRCYYAYINWRTRPSRYGTFMYRAGFLRDKDYEELRIEGPGPIFDAVGWHWSSVGRRDELERKLAAYSHYLETPAHAVLPRIDSGLDIWGRSPSVEQIDHEFPQYIQDNWETRYRHFVWPPV